MYNMCVYVYMYVQIYMYILIPYPKSLQGDDNPLFRSNMWSLCGWIGFLTCDFRINFSTEYFGVFLLFKLKLWDQYLR